MVPYNYNDPVSTPLYHALDVESLFVPPKFQKFGIQSNHPRNSTTTT